ncbi:MAG: hypothetical protein IJI37_07870 [Opitutales bacterium]|nr:hypothetical protein [Opitutales bacterium]
MDKILTNLENVFARLRAAETRKQNCCAIAENNRGGFSIYLGKNIRIGNYATYADARNVAEKWNFFVVEN